MIELSLAEFFVGALGLAFLGSAVSVYVDRRRDHRRARAIRRRTLRCRICGWVFPHSGSAGTQECPGCGRANQPGRDRRLG